MTTARALTAAIAAETSEVYLVLLTIDHADLAEPLRFVANTEAITSRGETYEAFPFAFIPPEEREGAPARATLQIDNVDQRIAATIRALTSRPSVLAEIVLAATPDVVERAWPTLELMSAEWDALTVEGELGAPNDADEPASAWVFNPAFAPALHR